jgi:hypothetical protein
MCRGTAARATLARLQLADQDGGSTTGLDEVLKLLQGTTYGADGSAVMARRSASMQPPDARRGHLQFGPEMAAAFGCAPAWTEPPWRACPADSGRP